MKKQHILGFFDALARTPVFLFLCAMFLCGALAGGLTGLHASEGDCAVALTALLSELPTQALKSMLCSVMWLVLPLVCMRLRPAMLFLSGLAAARGFVLALTVAIGIGQQESLLLSLCAAGLPAIFQVAALLAACTMVWQSGEVVGRYSLRSCRAPYISCVLLTVFGALLRIGFALLWNL